MAPRTIFILLSLTALLLGGCASSNFVVRMGGGEEAPKTSRCGDGFEYDIRKVKGGNHNQVLLAAGLTSNLYPCALVDVTNGQRDDSIQVENVYTGEVAVIAPGETHSFVMKGYKGRITIAFRAIILDKDGNLTGWVKVERVRISSYVDVDSIPIVVRWVRRPHDKERRRH